MTDATWERIPPQSIEAEQAALGAMILEREAIERAVEMIQPEDFYRESHRLLYLGVLDLFQSRQPVDLITLGEWLAARKQLETVGGTLYLSTMMEHVPTAAGIGHYCAIVKAKAIQRALIKASDEIMEAAYRSDRDLDELIAESEEKIHRATDMASGDDYLPMWYDVAVRTVQNKVTALLNGTPTGILTPWEALNRELRPLRPKQVVIVAGRPGSGKTLAGLQWARHMGEAGYPGAVFTAELDGEQLIERDVIANMGDYGEYYYDLQGLDKSDLINAANDALDSMKHLPIAICDDADTLAKIERRVRQEKRRWRERGQRLHWILVDYLQLLNGDGKGQYDVVSQLSKGMKTIARNHKLAVVVLAQLSRKCEERDVKRPMLSDLRESGQIEQDAHSVILLYRPGYYGAEECVSAFLPSRRGELRQGKIPHDELDGILQQYGQYTQMCIAKQRDGKPGGWAWLRFNGARYRFSDISASELRMIVGGGR